MPPLQPPPPPPAPTGIQWIPIEPLDDSYYDSIVYICLLPEKIRLENLKRNENNPIFQIQNVEEDSGDGSPMCAQFDKDLWPLYKQSVEQNITIVPVKEGEGLKEAEDKFRELAQRLTELIINKKDYKYNTGRRMIKPTQPLVDLFRAFESTSVREVQSMIEEEMFQLWSNIININRKLIIK